MDQRQAFAFDTGAADAVVAPPARVFENVLRRVAGDGAVNLLRAKSEVFATLRAHGGDIPRSPALDDAVPPEAVPSVAAGQREDRLLAEIDQDGFAFAASPIDEPFFNRRERHVPRQQNLLDVALVGGRLCVRKRFRGYRMNARRWGDRPVPARDRALRSLWVNLGIYLYTEAAALLRLKDLPFVPKLRGIDLADRAIYVDYVQGESLRSLAGRGGAAVMDHDLSSDPALAQLSARDLERREVALLESATGGEFRREIAFMVNEVNARGVAPLDIKLGNFIRGAATGRLYWIDFEICRLASQPRWDADLAVEREILEEVFDLSRHGHPILF